MLNPHFLACQDYGKANLFRARSILPTLNERPPERNERPPLSDLQVRPWDVDPGGGCFEVCGWKKSTSCYWVYPIISHYLYEVSTIQGGAGFFPSTKCGVVCLYMFIVMNQLLNIVK